MAGSIHAATYYVSPTGNDAALGTQSAPWKSLDKGTRSIHAGDTLILRNGTWTGEALRLIYDSGTANNPITVRAENDGKAIVDGAGIPQYVLELGQYFVSPLGHYNIVEGIVFKNSAEHVIHDIGHDNVIRRVSAYNANTDKNAQVILWSGTNGLIEDCVAAGSGRKMIELGDNVTVRRCVAYGKEWLGRDFCGAAWPWIDGIQVYNGNNNIVENVLVFGPYPVWGLSVQANDPNAVSNNNKFYGSAIIGAGYADLAGTQWTNYFTSGALPQPNNCNRTTPILYDNHSVGMQIWGQGAITNNVFKDILSINSAGLGYSNAWPSQRVADSGNSSDHLTLIHNGAHNTTGDNQKSSPLFQAAVGSWPLTNSIIQSTFNSNNSAVGARLQYRYINGVLKDGSDGTPAQSLWPWPMEERIKAEFATIFNKSNFSINYDICQTWLAKAGVNAVTNCSVGITATPAPIATPTPTTKPTVTPTVCSLKSLGDADCNRLIDLVDFEIWRKEYTGSSTAKSADFNTDNFVNIVDFEIWRKHYF